MLSLLQYAADVVDRKFSEGSQGSGGIHFMNVAQAFCQFDSEASLRWLRHARSQLNHDLFLLPSREVDSTPHLEAAKDQWRSVTVLYDYHNAVSDWSQGEGNQTNCASGPNSSFRQFARYFHDNKLGPWFWVEADCVMLSQDAIDRIEKEYLEVALPSGKTCMGCYVDFPVPHSSGNGVYSEECALLVDLMLPHMSDDKKREIGFDIAGARQIFPLAHITTLIQHKWRAEPFTSQADFDARVDSRALFYHSNKDGSIYQFLRKEGDAICAATVEESLASMVPITIGAKPLENSPTRQSNGAVTSEPETAPPNNHDYQTVTRELLTETFQLTPRDLIGREVSLGAIDRAAKARAALAAKRATGWKPGPYKKRRRRRVKAAKN